MEDFKMWNEPSENILSKIPKLYETEGIELKEKLIYLHFFIGSCDWYVTEYDGENVFFGFAILNNDLENAEWGYVSFSELKSISIGICQVDCEMNWKVRKAFKIEKICKAQRWNQDN